MCCPSILVRKSLPYPLVVQHQNLSETTAASCPHLPLHIPRWRVVRAPMQHDFLVYPPKIAYIRRCQLLLAAFDSHSNSFQALSDRALPLRFWHRGSLGLVGQIFKIYFFQNFFVSFLRLIALLVISAPVHTAAFFSYATFCGSVPRRVRRSRPSLHRACRFIKLN